MLARSLGEMARPLRMVPALLTRRIDCGTGSSEQWRQQQQQREHEEGAEGAGMASLARRAEWRLFTERSSDLTRWQCFGARSEHSKCLATEQAPRQYSVKLISTRQA